MLVQDRITRADLRANPGSLYLFGDNHARVGMGGQAAQMRGEPNAVGVRTKWRPTTADDAYFRDEDLEVVVPMILDDLRPAFVHAAAGGVVVVPAAGLGTGLAGLPRTAPRVHAFLEAQLAALGRL